MGLRAYVRESLGWLRELDRHWLIALGSLILCGVIAIYVMTVVNQAHTEWSRTEKYANQLAKYQYLKGKVQETQRNEGDSIENPLSYLESTVEKNNLGELTPVGSTETGREFRFAVTSLEVRRVAELLKRFSARSSVYVKRFNFQRVSLESSKFDATFELIFS